MFIITHPPHCQAEFHYIVDVIFNEFLGLEYKTVLGNTEHIVISAEGRNLELPDNFFSKAQTHWLKTESLPQTPLLVWNTDEVPFDINLVKSEIPIIFGKGGYSSDGTAARLDIDIFGSAFFMLSRYEEAVKPDRDAHDRFPATASLAWQEGFLDRPIVNEYVEILWACMEQFWPDLQRKKRTHRTLISCDVDHPYRDGVKNFRRMIRQCGGDILIRKDLKLAISGLVNYALAKFGVYRFDACYNAVYWIMDVNEAAGNKVIFFFKAGRTNGLLDADYSLDEPVVRNLMRDIHARGHEIGLHPSYDTYLDPGQLAQEAVNLRKTAKHLGIRQEKWGSRQHYLRWQTSATARNLDAVGIDYDSTLTYADYIGFRCGVCYEYPIYDLKDRKPLAIRECPLIIMEGSVFGKDYMGLHITEDTTRLMLQYKQKCFQFKGDFTLLWHNTEFLSRKKEECYQLLVACIDS